MISQVDLFNSGMYPIFKCHFRILRWNGSLRFISDKSVSSWDCSIASELSSTMTMVNVGDDGSRGLGSNLSSSRAGLAESRMLEARKGSVYVDASENIIESLA